MDRQRIEGPLHAPDAVRRRITALLPFKLRAKTAIAIGRAKHRHVRMKIRARPIRRRLHARQRHGETNQASIRSGRIVVTVAIKRADR